MTETSRLPAPANSSGQAQAGGRSAPGEAAQRALAEARERRLLAAPAPPREINGRGGLEPVRYGDWEVNGLASDF